MASDDSKTRIKSAAVKRRGLAEADLPTGPARAVKRRQPTIAEVPTGPAKAVKRRPRAEGLEGLLEHAQHLKVLRRGSLVNAAGKEDNGWVVRDSDGSDLCHCALSDESVFKTVARTFGHDADYFLDVMVGASNVGCLVLDAVEVDPMLGLVGSEGSGELLDAEAVPQAKFLVRRLLRVDVYPQGQTRPALSMKPMGGTVHAMAGSRLVATLLPLKEGERPRAAWEVSFHNNASGLEKLWVVVGAVLSDAFTLEADARETRRNRG